MKLHCSFCFTFGSIYIYMSSFQYTLRILIVRCEKNASRKRILTNKNKNENKILQPIWWAYLTLHWPTLSWLLSTCVEYVCLIFYFGCFVFTGREQFDIFGICFSHFRCFRWFSLSICHRCWLPFFALVNIYDKKNQ